jgi:hypothetical protein
MRSGRPHWLQVGGATKTPGVIVSFDTETEPQTRDGTEYLTLRCWDAIVRHRPPGAVRGGQTMHWDGEQAGELADVLVAAAGVNGEAWAFAHNAGFDLTVTSLPMVLADRGWKPVFVNLGDETCVFVLESDAGRLVITDTWSWLRCSLATAAKDVGMRKVKLPDDDDTLAAWHRRCKHDVEILDRLLEELLAWWDTQQLGSFAVTGASCGWRAMRSMIPAKSILVGAQPPRTQLERDAIFGGRKEVWQVGRIQGRNIEDWDLAAAHLTTVAHLPMPTRPLRPGRLTASLDALAPPDGLGGIFRVEVVTRTPCCPVRAGDEVWWPVGRFRTTLTSPELAGVLEQADRVRVLGGEWYWLDDALKGWAQWCAELQAQHDTVVPRVAKRVAKSWGRAVPGRFALRTSELIGERPATHLGWKLETGHDLDTGEELEIITYGGVERVYRRDQDGADVNPAILAYVEGYVRRAMGQTIAAREPALLLQCNTDGWWEIRAGRSGEDPAGAVPAPYRAVRKATSRDVTVYGPNHLSSKDDRRLAGVPKDAAQRLDGAFVWQDWPGLRWQLQFSRPGEYLRPGRELLLADHYCRRWVLKTGETVPVTMSWSRASGNVLEPWSRTADRRSGDELAEWQVQALQPLADVLEPWQPPARPPLERLPGRR